MSGAQIGGVVGGIIGFVASGYNPQGAYWGYAAGSMIGGYVAPGSLPDITQVGPRLSDLRPQSSEYGRPIPIIYGKIGTAGNVIWQSDIIEVATETTQESGGKGSTPSQSTSQTTFAYYGNFAVAFCEGPGLILRMWAGPEKRLIYDSRSASSTLLEGGTIRLYDGSEDQLPDPLIESFEGVGNVPAYRGSTYAVFEQFPLVKDGNRLPFIFAEIASGWEMELPPLVNLGERGNIAAYDSNTGYLWSSYLDSGVMTVSVTDFASGTLVKTITTPAGDNNDGNGMCCATNSGTVWIPRDSGEPAVEIFSATGMIRINTITGGSFYGLLRYDKNKGRVWRCRTNLSASIIQYDEDGASVTATATLAGGGVYAISEVVFLDDKKTAAVLLHDRIALIASDTLEESESIAHTGSAIAGDGKMKYDTKRDRLLITTASLGDDFIVVDINSRSTSLHTVAGGGSCVALVWIEATDKYAAVMSFQSDTIHIINPDTFEEEDAYGLGGGFTGSLAGDYVAIPRSWGYMAFAQSGSHDLYKIPVANVPTVQEVTLSSVVGDLCARAGLDVSQYDSSDLDDTVEGYILAKQMTCRAALEPLQQVYYFDAIESDGIVKFVARGSNVMLDIPDEHLAAHIAGENPGEPLEVTRRMENELPKAVTVNYMLEATDYSNATKISQRLIGSSGDRVSLDMPMVLSDPRAQEVTEVNLYSAWLQRLGYSFPLWKKYAALEPTDVIRIKGHIIRITDITETPTGILKCQGVADDPACYDPYVVVTPTPPSTKTVATVVPTNSVLLDIAMLRDADDDAGFYWAAAGYGDDWRGASLFKSIDGGANYTLVSSTTNPAIIGIAVDALPDFTGGNIFDEGSSVTVALNSGSLTSTTDTAVLNGANAAVLGDEVIQFKTATLNGDGTYTLTGLLRGRRGTEWAMSEHTAGERFVLADVSTWRRVYMDSSEIGLERLYKAVSLGGTLASAPTIAFTNNAVGLEPYSPTHITGTHEDDGDIKIDWIRRTRVGGSWRDYVDTPISEDSELYDVEVYSDPSYLTLLRTVSSLTSPTMTYTNAQQITDSGSPPASAYYVKVFQRSALVGRGFEGRGSI